MGRWEMGNGKLKRDEDLGMAIYNSLRELERR